MKIFNNLRKSVAIAQAFISGEEGDAPLKNLLYLRSKEGKTLLSRFKFPVASGYVEMLIRRTLRLPDQEKLTDDHLKIAVVSSLIYPLRQVIGSCFATAPAIYIQNQLPERLLLDLYDLMMMGRIKRTFGGEEYVVPISPKWGGRENDHPLLRAWEYTIASYADYKVTFSRWNLYQSLGLDPKKGGGIGAFIYKKLQEKLEDTNKQVEKLHDEYVRAIDEARVSQALLRQADSPDRMRMRKAELEVRAHHADVCKDMRDKANEKAQSLSQFFPFLIGNYVEAFQDHFLEVFDAEAHYTDETLLEDSPAGFRLVYKHGRSDPTAWSFIQNEEDFFGALRHFFLAVEPQISAVCEWEEGKKEIELLTTEIVHLIDTDSFHAFALKKKKPWSYTSGGSFHTLLKGYFSIEGEIAEEKRPIESPLDLLTFLIDLLKALPYRVTKPFETDPHASLFMYSPTHAFLLRPGLSPFKEGWLDKGFTYTWIRDHLIDPAKSHYESIRLDASLQTLVAEKIFSHGFHPSPGGLTLPEFRVYLINMFPNRGDDIDNLLFQSFSTIPPLPFADTNWADYFFAFAVNPATFELDLYRMSIDGNRIYPMTPWRHYLDGTTKEDWGVLTHPTDFSGAPLSDLALKLKKI
ncbi:MAG: hypothetical protein KDK71_03960 [Chlamydiia bacterium]|nr:hypothetical protein [Chlamydiia bacterium]